MTIPMRQASWATMEYLAYPIAMFALAPFFVQKLGAHGYGLWMVLIALSGFGGVAGFGMGVVTTREIAWIRGKGDLTRSGEVLRTCLMASICGCAALAAIYCIFWIALPVGMLERVGAPDEIAMLLLASIVVVLFEQVDAVFAGAIRGAERFDLSSRAEVVSRLSAIGLCAVSTLFSGRLAVFFAVVALCAALRMLVKATIAIRLLGPLKLNSKFEWQRARAMIGFGGWVWVQSLGSFLFAAADRLLIGSLIGSAAVGVYAILTQLAQQIHAIPSAGASVLFPLASRMRAEGVSVMRSGRSAFLLVLVVAVLLGVPVWLLGDRVVSLWMGNSFAAMGGGVLGVLALAYLLLAVCIVPHYLLLALGSARLVALLNLAAGVAALVFCWLAIPVLGLAGAAWGKVVYAAVLIVGIAAFGLVLRHGKAVE